MMNKVKPVQEQQKNSQNGKKGEKQPGDSQEKSSDMRRQESWRQRGFRKSQ